MSRVRREVTRGGPAAPVGHRAHLSQATSQASSYCAIARLPLYILATPLLGFEQHALKTGPH